MTHPRLVIAVSLAFCLASALAATGSDPQAALERACEYYRLHTAVTVPDGIQPVPIESAPELHKAIAEIRHVAGHTSRSQQGGQLLTANLAISPPGTVCYHTHRQLLISHVCPTYFHLWADVWVETAGQWQEIEYVYEWVGISGCTLIFGISDEWSYHRIAWDCHSVYVRGGATLDYYFLIKGIIKVFSEPISTSYTFSL